MPERTYSFIETRLPMPLMSAAAEPGKLDEAVAHIAAHDVELGRIARAEAHYFRGQPEEAHADAAPFLDHSDSALRISANFICAYADLALGKIWETRECLANIAAMRNDESIKATPALHASYMLFDAASSVLLHLPTPLSAGHVREPHRRTTRRPAPFRDLRARPPRVSFWRIRPLCGHGRNRAHDETRALSHRGAVSAPCRSHGADESKGCRSRAMPLHGRVGHCLGRRPC